MRASKLTLMDSCCSCMQEWRTPPYWLTWLRFTAFLLLYPVGVASEMATVRLAYPAIQEQRTLCIDMPNRINFALDYPFCCLILTCLYLPGKTTPAFLPVLLFVTSPAAPLLHRHAQWHQLCAGVTPFAASSSPAFTSQASQCILPSPCFVVCCEPCISTTTPPTPCRESNYCLHESDSINTGHSMALLLHCGLPAQS